VSEQLKTDRAASEESHEDELLFIGTGPIEKLLEIGGLVREVR